MSMTKEPTHSLSDSLKKLEAITHWFETQEEIDVEKALEKVREGATLLKQSKLRLKEVENEFATIKHELDTL